jgi:hypothetical protein
LRFHARWSLVGIVRRLAPIALALLACNHPAPPRVTGASAVIAVVDACGGAAISTLDHVTVSIPAAGWSQQFSHGDLPSLVLDDPPRVTSRVMVIGFIKGLSDPSAVGVTCPIQIESGRTIDVTVDAIGTFHRDTCQSGPQIDRFGATIQPLGPDAPFLVAGGANITGDASGSTFSYLRLVETYDACLVRYDAVGDLGSGKARAFHTTSPLPDGRVLLAGGEALVQAAQEDLASTLIIDARDPQNATFGDGPVMLTPRALHTATTLADGRILVAGGEGNAPGGYLDALELFDPNAGTFASAGASLLHARGGHSAFLLDGGADVLIAGGQNASTAVSVFELIHVDRARVAIAAVDTPIGFGPIAHAAAQTATKEIVLSGGYATFADADQNTGALAVVEVWRADPTHNALTRLCSGTMSTARARHTASILGKTLVFAGGLDASGAGLASAESIDLAIDGSTCTLSPPRVTTLAAPRFDHRAVVSPERGELRLFGGQVSAPFGASTEAVEIYRTIPE